MQPPPKNPQKVYIEELPPQEWKEKPDERVVYERNPQSDKVDAIYNLSKVYKDVLATDFKNSDDWKVWREVIKIIDPKTYATGQNKKPYSLIKLYKPWKAEKEDAASWLMRLLTKTSNVRPLLAYLADPDYFEDVARNPDIIKEVARESANGNFFYHPGLTLSSSKPQTPRQGTRRAIA